MAIAEFLLEGADGPKVLVEVDEMATSADGVRGFRGGSALAQAGQTFEASIAGIKTVAGKVLSVVKELAADQGEVTLGFKLTASSGVILAKVGGEANIGVKLLWKKDPPAGSTPLAGK